MLPQHLSHAAGWLTPALAYADPGAGALLWQLLVAAGLGVVFYLRRFRGLFSARGKQRSAEDGQEHADEDRSARRDERDE